ncbi:MAG: hypothetical protein EOO75_03625 [Myxococcales bacterium]|nr:MAG: hypothetical protein EOO75_03625 [Myxococcales bacterium]
MSRRPLDPRERRSLAVVLAVAAVARAAVVLWASSRIVPTADAVYYHKLATRLAAGAGYTWLWPDGVVTFAAHYPVGYPWLLSLVYRLVGPVPAAGALLNAALALAGVAAVWDLTRRSAGLRAAWLAGLLAALDPALVLYTPALMTEGVTASLLALAAWAAAVAHDRSPYGTSGDAPPPRPWPWLLAAGALLGLATLVRPQCVLVAPLLGWAAWRARGSLAVTGAALAVVLPWTLRNCTRMGRCALVSVNGGWNLLIGAGPNANGHWAPVDVPPACREVFDEAGKDACFGEAARQMIAADPGRWLRLVPARLGATFDYCGAGPWYLHDAAPDAFPDAAKVTAGAAETLIHRLMLAAALVALARWPGGLRRTRLAIGAAGVALALVRPGWVAYALLAALAALVWASGRPRSFVAAALFAVLGTTLAVHAAFFGAGRYSLVVFPLMASAVGALLTARPRQGDTAPHAPDRDGRGGAAASPGHRERPVALQRREDRAGNPG